MEKENTVKNESALSKIIDKEIKPFKDPVLDPDEPLLVYKTEKILGGTTMRNPALPENNNMALHVCLDPKAVLENRKRLAGKTPSLENWVVPWQKHTANFVRVTKNDAGKGSLSADTSIMNVDGLYTTDPDLLIGVFTADCLGILIADDTTPLVGVVHSGWKGTVSGILHQALETLIENKLINPETVQIYFSPSILKNSFQIGEDVKEALIEAGEKIGLDFSNDIETDPDDPLRYYADHQNMNIKVAESFGIPGEHIHGSDLDTKTNLNCFSFRRDKEKTGEHFTFGWIQS